jgi:hypothetical protein
MIGKILIIIFICLIIGICLKKDKRRKRHYINSLIDNVEKDNSNKLNPYFNDVQFHKDYWDVISSFNDISIQKQYFNVGNKAVTISSPNINELHEVVDYVIKLLNYTNKNEVPETNNHNTGWDELSPLRNVVSGWKKSNEKVGVPEIYDDPIKKNKVKLINISNAEKFETMSEIRYICNLVIQKEGVEDQMLLKIKLTFDKKRKNGKYEVSIEEMFVIGFLTFIQTGRDVNDVHDITLAEVNGITEDNVIIHELNKKFEAKEKLMNQFGNNLGEEDKMMYESMPDTRFL